MKGNAALDWVAFFLFRAKTRRCEQALSGYPRCLGSPRTQPVCARTQLVCARTQLVSTRTQLVSARTRLVSARIQLVSARSQLVGRVK